MLPATGGLSSADKKPIKGIPLSLPCRSEGKSERQKNPDMLTPKGPQQVPYALAGGLEPHAPPIIHGSLAPSDPKTFQQRGKMLTGSRSTASRKVAGGAAASPSDEISVRRAAAATALEHIVASRTQINQWNGAPSVAIHDQQSSPFMTEEMLNPMQPSPSFGEPRHRGDTMAISPNVAADHAPGSPALPVPPLDAYRDRLRNFIRRTECGVRCRVCTPTAVGSRLATYMYHVHTGTIRIIPIASGPDEVISIRLTGICNIWVDSDEAGDRCGIVKPMEVWPQASDTGTAPPQLFGTSLDGFMHLDTCDGHVALIERDADAREEFLDCVAALIATARHRARMRGERPPSGRHGGSPRQELLSAWRPPGERSAPPARSFEALRPKGASLTAEFLTGAAGDLLTQVGEAIVPDVTLV